MRQKLISLTAAFALAVSVVMPMTPTYAVLAPTDLSAEAAILMDADSGQVLFDKNGSKAMYPASTTKILTALIIAEDCKLEDRVIIDKKSPFTDGSRIYVIEGEDFSVRQLLQALLLESANDAAVALAIYHSGTVEQFAKKMNERAKALGATASNFVNPNGLPNEQHVTSAKDLALIAKEVMKHPELMEIVKTPQIDLAATNKQPEIRHLYNSNRFLFGTGPKNKIQYKGETIDIKYDIVTGMKTGYTNAAQQCFVVTATKDDKNLIAVILKGQAAALYTDPRQMIDFGLENFKPYEFVSAGQLIQTLDIQGGKKAKVNLYTATALKGLIPLDVAPEKIEKVINVQNNIQLPLKENQVLGDIAYVLNGQVICKTNLVNLSNISNQTTIGAETTRYFDWLNIDKSPLGITILVVKFIAALVLWRFIVNKLYPKPKKKAKKRRRPDGQGSPPPPQDSRQRPRGTEPPQRANRPVAPQSSQNRPQRTPERKPQQPPSNTRRR